LVTGLMNRWIPYSFLRGFYALQSDSGYWFGADAVRFGFGGVLDF
jgi:hypothetical protein